MPPSSILSVDKWRLNMESSYVTIADILQMNKGDQTKFLCLDRNFGDLICCNELMPACKPEDFCKNCYTINYTHINDLHGLWDNDPFNFHLNYKPGHWYPLNDKGFLPKTDPQQLAHLHNVKRDYRAYSKQTWVGWRGPMLKWTDVTSSNDLLYLPTYNEEGDPLPYNFQGRRNAIEQQLNNAKAQQNVTSNTWCTRMSRNCISHSQQDVATLESKRQAFVEKKV